MLLARAERLERALAVGAAKPIALFPEILSIDEWERQAIDSQRRLVMDTRGWLGEDAEPAVLAHDPHDVSNQYKTPRTLLR
jgi:hypothetical protein